MPPMRANLPLARAMRQTGAAGSRQLNDELIARVVAGDKQAIERMITSNMALVVRKCRAYLRSRPKLAHQADDMVSAGFVALTLAVQRLAEAGPKENGNVTGYLSIAIVRAFRSFSDCPLAMSAGTRFTKSKAGEQLPRTVDVEPVESGHDPAGLQELREELNACALTDDDRTILRMREQNFSDREIGIQLGKSTTHVFNARRAIEARFLARQSIV